MSDANSQQIRTAYNVGQWMPSDQETLAAWMRKIMAKADCDTGPLLPSVQNLKDLIENDAKAYMFFTQMFDQVSTRRKTSPVGLPQVRDYQHMLRLFNVILTHAPEFNENGLVGCPFNAMLDWSMATVGGWAGFLDETINAHLRDMLNEWGVFLQSRDSAFVLNDDPKSGWFGADAQKAMPTFVQDFQCDPSLPHHGYKSWDDFFTREFRDGVRPIAEPDNDAVIVNACESAPYRLAHNVQLRDKFWIKAQPYALQFMMDGDALAEHFIGGTIYQAYLSALSYHRWHAPVSGRVVKTRLIEGTYFSEALVEGPDPSGPDESQAYIAEVATRGLVFIEADNPDIGLMCFMAIGMADVSTCDIRVFEGQHVRKGDEIGMFHFGGSTHCLFFGPDVTLDFDLHGHTPGLHSGNIPLNARLATVRPREAG
jgi:phosphatidylserine decarboxylase